MSRFRAVAIDLDGTLLTTDKRVTDASLTALRALVANAVHVLIVTGRNLPMARRAVKSFDFGYAMIAHNGAVVADGQSGRISSANYLTDGAVQTLARDFRRHDCEPFVYGSVDSVFQLRRRADERNPALTRYLEANAPISIVIDDPIAPSNGWRPIHLVAIEPRERVEAAVASNIRVEGATVMTSGGLYDGTHWFLEAIHAEASKVAATRSYGEAHGFALRDVLAIGDNLNDLELLKACRCGVAMSNARDDVKAVADWVAPSNDEEGVAAAIARFLH